MNNSKQLVIATGNKSKLDEFKSLLEGYDVISIPVETKETQGTAEEVILEKAKQTYKILKRKCIVEDTSFGFDEWNGLPGPYIKDFVKLVGLEKLSKITKNKRAKITCLVALANSAEDILIFRGESTGEVVDVGGNNGFDFDKIFIPDGYAVRFSEMASEEKNKRSHRFKAIIKLKEYLEKERS